MDTLYCCSFCGKNQHEAEHIFTNQQACFCNECGDLCSKLMTSSGSLKPNRPASISPCCRDVRTPRCEK
jgi:ATP-dependent protease Clp ATPase subunit